MHELSFGNDFLLLVQLFQLHQPVVVLGLLVKHLMIQITYINVLQPMHGKEVHYQGGNK